MFEDHIKRTLIGRLHALLDEAANVPNVNNAELVHEFVKEAVRYGGVVREGLPSNVDLEQDRTHRFWRGSSAKG